MLKISASFQNMVQNTYNPNNKLDQKACNLPKLFWNFVSCAFAFSGLVTLMGKKKRLYWRRMQVKINCQGNIMPMDFSVPWKELEKDVPLEVFSFIEITLIYLYTYTQQVIKGSHFNVSMNVIIFLKNVDKWITMDYKWNPGTRLPDRACKIVDGH